MIFPVLHLNGTSREGLMDPIRDACGAVQEAIGALEDAAPNARDYYPLGPDAFETARREHGDRVRRLREVRDELIVIHQHLYEVPRRPGEVQR